MSPLFIVNPASAFHRTARRFKKFIPYIQNVFPDASIRYTEYAGHATDLCARALKDGNKRIIAVGGDGTVNEVINGFFDDGGILLQPDAALGIFPSGSGGDFARPFGWSKDPEKELLRLAKDSIAPVDVGRIFATGEYGERVERYYLNVASLGLSGLVASYMDNTSRILGATAAYYFATCRALLQFDPQPLRLSVDDQTVLLSDCSLIAFANGCYFGGGMKIAPQAHPQDGLLDCVAVTGVGLWFFLQHGHAVYKGNHTALPQVHQFRGRHMLVEPSTDKSIFVEADGEQVGQLPASFEIMPNAVRLIH